jgi:PAS domain S-box-containing protein
MSSLRDKSHRFFFAEEVPRALGLALVLVHVFGLAAMLFFAERHARQRDGRRGEEISIAATTTLAGTLATQDKPPSEWLPTLQRFARSHNATELRIYDRERKIQASLAPTEAGSTLPTGDEERAFPTQATLEAAGGASEAHLRHCVRAPLGASLDSGPLFIEAVLERAAPSMADGPWRTTWPVAAVSLAALLLVYRRLRRHFHSVTCIAQRLVQAKQLEQQLQELRLTDTQDQVSSCWNKLIDLTLALEEEVSRSTASADLMAALTKTNAGELAEALTTVPVGVLLLNDAGAVSYANAMATRVIGWTKSIKDGLSIHDEVPPEGKPLIAAMAVAIQQNDSRRAFDRQVEAGDGSFYHLEVVPVRTAQHTRGYAVLMLDVSQKVRADKAREEFVSQVTHELRTPLTNIRAYAETLSSGMFDDPKVITECYNVITKETRRLGRLVEDILSISQLEVGTMQLVFDDVDLRPLLTEAVRDVRGLAESKKQDLQLILPPKLPKLRGDRDKLAVVFNNLLGNALKYTPQGGQITASCKVTEDAVHISVRDTGIGVDPKDQGRIFEKFVRVDDDAVQKEAGTGIGLTTAREIVQQHGGQITVMSRKGEGATFTAILPLDKSRTMATAETRG